MLLRAIEHFLERKVITDLDAKILKRVVDQQVVSASDIKEFFPGKADAEVSRQIKKIIDRKMLMPEKEGKRKYDLRFDNSYLIRSIIKLLGDKGFCQFAMRCRHVYPCQFFLRGWA